MSDAKAAGEGSASRRALWAWSFYDWANQSFATVIQTFIFAAYFTNRVATDAEHGTIQWSLTIGGAGLLVAVCGPLLGAVADRGGRRKPWLAGFTVVCAVATACLWFVRPGAEGRQLALWLLAVGVFGAQMAAVFYNAMLGDLATRRRFGRWSGRGWALGYAGGIGCLAAVLVLFVGDHAWFDLDREAALHIRAVFPFVAGWLLVFSLPLLLLTPDEPARTRSLRDSAAQGWSQLKDSLRDFRRHRGIVRFLIGRAIYMDGLATVFALGGVYAAGTFGMDEREVLWFGIALSVAAGLGALGFSRIDDRFGSRRTILAALMGLLVFSVLILMVRERTWFWVGGLLLGIFVGPVQSSSRSYLSHVAPPELRTQMFGLYALADKATSFLGPLLVAGVTALANSQRVGLAVIPLLFAVGWLILRGVPETGVRNDPGADDADDADDADSTSRGQDAGASRG